MPSGFILRGSRYPGYHSNIPFLVGIVGLQILPDGSIKQAWRLVRLVTKESATQAIQGEKFHNQIALTASHSDIVKYTEDDDGNYVMVRGKLERYVKEAARIMGGNTEGGQLRM